MPIKTTKPPLPNELLKIIACDCKAGCKTKKCSCKNIGIKCSNLCHLGKNTICQNAENFIEEAIIDDNIESGVIQHPDIDEDDIQEANEEYPIDEDIHDDYMSDIFVFSDDETEEMFATAMTDSKASSCSSTSSTASRKRKHS